MTCIGAGEFDLQPEPDDYNRVRSAVLRGEQVKLAIRCPGCGASVGAVVRSVDPPGFFDVVIPEHGGRA